MATNSNSRQRLKEVFLTSKNGWQIRGKQPAIGPGKQVLHGGAGLHDPAVRRRHCVVPARGIHVIVMAVLPAGHKAQLPGPTWRAPSEKDNANELASRGAAGTVAIPEQPRWLALAVAEVVEPQSRALPAGSVERQRLCDDGPRVSLAWPSKTTQKSAQLRLDQGAAQRRRQWRARAGWGCL